MATKGQHLGALASVLQGIFVALGRTAALWRLADRIVPFVRQKWGRGVSPRFELARSSAAIQLGKVTQGSRANLRTCRAHGCAVAAMFNRVAVAAWCTAALGQSGVLQYDSHHPGEDNRSLHDMLQTGNISG